MAMAPQEWVACQACTKNDRYKWKERAPKKALSSLQSRAGAVARARACGTVITR